MYSFQQYTVCWDMFICKAVNNECFLKYSNKALYGLSQDWCSCSVTSQVDMDNAC